MSGYQDFKVTLAQDIVTPMQNIHEEISGEDPSEVIVDKVFQGTMQALTMTHDALDVNAIVKAADAIENARRVVILYLELSVIEAYGLGIDWGVGETGCCTT